MSFKVFLIFHRYSLTVCVVTIVAVLFFCSSLSKQNHEDPRARNGDNFVLIVTYMRSGSSLVGSILQSADEAFYIFERFHILRKAKGNRTTIKYINGSISSLPLDLNKEKNDAIYNWFTCDVHKISIDSFHHKYMNKSKKTSQVISCLSKNQDLPKLIGSQTCADELIETCLNSPLSIIKTICMNLESAGRLLKDLPNMKIIHLVRDPRATMFSRADVRQCEECGGIQSCTKIYCQTLRNDVNAMDRLVNQYPNRIKAFFYEDFALYPVEASSKLYEFVGAAFTKRAQDYITKITSSAKNNGDYGTSRSNSSEHVYTWQTEMNITFRNDVQKQCDYVFKRYKNRYEMI